jgi:hypothetical protein
LVHYAIQVDNNESSNSARTISTCSSIHPLCSEDCLDSVFTVDTRNSSDVNMTRAMSSGPSENRPLTQLIIQKCRNFCKQLTLPGRTVQQLPFFKTVRLYTVLILS